MLHDRDSGADTVVRVLDAVLRRVLVRHVLDGVTIAAACLLVAMIVLRARGINLPLGVAGAFLGASIVVIASVSLRRGGRTRGAAARIVERDSALANVVVTAEELQRQPGRVPDWLRARVFHDASRRLQRVDPSRAVPLKRPAVAAVAMVGVLIAAHVALPSGGVSGPLPTHGTAITALETDGRILVDLDPPAYARQSRRTLKNPSHLAVLEGTRARVTVVGGGTPVVRVGQRVLAVFPAAQGVTAETELRESGYLAIETSDPPSVGKRTTLIPVAVSPDALPSVRIDAPNRDLLVASATHALEVKATATDDLALDDMSLRYTKVSGSGEQFEFVEGELPIRITRNTDTNWSSSGEISLSRFGLAPGDSLVYRVTARDKRPGAAGSSSSDTFFIEVAGPGQVTLDGLEMPPERERYALSQQMIVLKIRRLRAREAKLSPSSLVEEAAAIAAEQRAVRANLVFLMGGDVEDEEEEAEHATDIQEGRLQNTAWREMSRAVAHMTTAEQRLIAVKTADALAAAKLAVESLQRAFGRSRYFLRAVPSRSRIDPSRRLSGGLDEAHGAEREASTGIADDEAAAARELLAEVLELVSAIRDQRPDARLAARLTSMTERVLAIKAVSQEWQALGRTLVQARDLAMKDSAGSELRARLDELTRALNAHARSAAIRVGAPRGSEGHLRGVWASEFRR